ncbi:hypothetical protein GCM10027300_41440 [Modestobacter lapidis]
MDVWPKASLVIEDDCTIGAGSVVAVREGVTIGAGTRIAELCSLQDANHVVSESGVTSRMVASPIRIGRGVWLGRGVAVLAGVNIGDGAVIGANAVVRADIPAGSVAVGVPARVIN